MKASPLKSLTAALLVGSLSMTETISALDILLTNDDGFDAPGIRVLRGALIAAGHQVTLVAPAENQSGKGGSLNTDALNFTPGEGLMALTHYGDGVFSLAGTPVDSVKAGLDIVLRDSPPDLVISGCNFGQNLGKPGSSASGTEGAALRATFRGIPAIACSIGINLAEAGDNFPSTVAALVPASDFIVRAVKALERQNGTQVLPNKTPMININFPVPYDAIQGVKITVLADGGDLELPLFDPSQGYPALDIPPLPFPSCADAIANGGSCFAGVGVGFSPEEAPRTDLGAHRQNYITVTPYSADMTGQDHGLSGSLRKLTP